MAIPLKSLSEVKIDVCKLTRLANARILDERRHAHEQRKGGEHLYMTKLDVLMIVNIPP